jgi:hypothetical protein
MERERERLTQKEVGGGDGRCWSSHERSFVMIEL